MRIIKFATRIFGCAALLFLSGCALMEERTLKPTDKSAVIKAGAWGKVYRGGYVELASINNIEPSWRVRSEMEVGVGTQSALFYVFLCQSDTKHCTSVAQSQISFRTEASHTYQVHAREQVTGRNQFWVWVVDEASGAVVGGAPPTT